MNDAAETTNSLVKAYIPKIKHIADEESVFEQFYRPMPKPEGAGTVVNFLVGTGRETAIQQAPGTPRISRKGELFEVEVHIPDKWRDTREITWEQIKRKRFDVVEAETRRNALAMAAARNRYLGNFLMTNAADNSGTPTDPTAPSTGETPHWWNTNDTKAPPPFGENTFSAGHDHVETGAGVAITADRLRDDVIKEIAEHGYGKKGIVCLVNLQEEASILKLANVAQQSQTLASEMRERFQKAGNVSAATGFLGLTFLRSNWVVAGAMPAFDVDLPNLPDGGAVRVVEEALQSRPDADYNHQTTIVESWESYGAGILDKGAGTVLHIA